MSDTFQLTERRRDSLALVRSDLVKRDLDRGFWLINGNPARRWYGRTLSELEQAGLIAVIRDETQADTVLTDAGREALAR